MSVNRSEGYLTSLAQRAFLKFWSFPNLSSKRGKELSDLLVVFGEDILIFSDKDCNLATDVDRELSWSRWYRHAVHESALQAIGASRWIRRNPDKIFRDANCTTPMEIPISPTARIHHILTVRGAASAARSEWGGRGSLVVTNRPLDACSSVPFWLGARDASGVLFHVIDEVALDAVLQTLDTAADFITYIRRREHFFLSAPDVVAASEEDLLGLYLMSYTQATNRLDFPHATGPVVVDGSHWDAWLASPQHKARQSANEISYVWDELIEASAQHAVEGTQEFTSATTLAEHERLLRWLSRETRFRRRILSQNLVEMLQATQPGQERRRYQTPEDDGDPYWILLVLPPPPDVPYEKYRVDRRTRLEQLTYVVKYLHPEARDIVGLAVGEDESGSSQDAICLDCTDFPEELLEVGRRLHEERGYFASGRILRQKHWDYPVEESAAVTAGER